MRYKDADQVIEKINKMKLNYAKQYNDSQKTGRIILSDFFNIKSGLGDLYQEKNEAIKDQFDNYLTVLENWIISHAHSGDDYPRGEKLKEELNKLQDEDTYQSLVTEMDTLLSDHFGNFNTEELRENIKDEKRQLLKELGINKSYDEGDFLLNSAYSNLESIRKVNLNLSAIKSIINQIVNQGFPQPGDLVFKDYNKEELESDSKSKAGRKYDKSAPQEDIEYLVHELITKAKSGEEAYKRYWHFDGAHMETPNKNQIAEEIIKRGLGGELDKRQILRRINKAISDMT